MNILSLQFGHNATVAYIEDGVLKYVLQEEKFDNIKNSSNFPLSAIRHIGKRYDFSKIDRIVFCGLSLHEHCLVFDEHISKDPKAAPAYKSFRISLYDRVMYMLTKNFPGIFNTLNDYKIHLNRKKHMPKLLALLSEGMGIDVQEPMIDFVEHHVCHALSPIYFYGLHLKSEPILIFTLDGSGDKYSSTVRVWENGEMKTLATTRFLNSLGFIRSGITSGLGMKPLEHEYKVMGLAAYTEEKYFRGIYENVFKDIIKVDGLDFKAAFPTNRAYMYFRDRFYENRFDNIAGALQYMTEKLVLERIQNAVSKTGIKKIATSGGVFMNVKLNKKIQEADFIEKVYFMPSCGDESNVIGGIMGSYLHNGYDINSLQPLNSMYYGISYEEDEITSFVENLDPNIYQKKDLESDANSASVIAEMVADFEVIGVVRGAGERGARSLCNRAILANASDLKSFHRVNDMIKIRDFWMPFAPVILEDAADRYIKDRDKIGKKSKESHQYMISAIDSTPLAQEDLRASIHQKDKTLRPQLVNKENHEWMYDVLKKYETITGLGGMMNTSLNIHGYPLVGTLEQAMFTLDNSGMKHLLLGNYLISKK